MKRPVLLLFAVAMTAALLARSAAPVAACSCASGDEVSLARSLLEYSQLVLVGTIADAESEYSQFDVEAVYKGESTARITLDQTKNEVELNRENAARYGYPDLSGTGPGDCSIILLGRHGQRYVVGLAESDEVSGAYTASLCATINETPASDEWSWQKFLASLDDLSGGALRPDGLPVGGGAPGQSDVSKLPLAVAAIAIPVVFLLIAAFVWPRRTGGP